MTDTAADLVPVASLFAGVVGQDARRRPSCAPRPADPCTPTSSSGTRWRAHRDRARASPPRCCARREAAGTATCAGGPLLGIHPDLVEFERAGAASSVEDAREIVQLAARRPLEAHRQVIVVPEIELALTGGPGAAQVARGAAGATIFVLLAEFVPADLATIASRCVRVDLRAVPEPDLTAWLESRGVEGVLAADLATAAGGSADRARILADDAGFAARLALWRSVPARLDGTGASVGTLVDRAGAAPWTRRCSRYANAIVSSSRPWPARRSRWARAESRAEGESRIATSARSGGGGPTSSVPGWRRWRPPTATAW